MRNWDGAWGPRSSACRGNSGRGVRGVGVGPGTATLGRLREDALSSDRGASGSSPSPLPSCHLVAGLMSA